MLPRSLRALVFLLAVALLNVITQAQVPDPVLAAAAPVPGVGHHYIGMGAEIVNPADGSLTFDLPLLPATDRGLTLPFGIHFAGSNQYVLSNQYAGNYGNLAWSPAPVGAPLQIGAWSYNLPVVSAQSAVIAVYPICGQYGCDPNPAVCYALDNYEFHGLDGQQTSLGLGSMYSGIYHQACGTDQRTPSTRHGIFASLLDQSHTPAIKVVDQSGTTYQFAGVAASEPSSPYYHPNPGGVLASSITDRNGNQITLSGNGYQDSTGRTAVSWTGIGGDGDQITVAGLGGPVTLHWTTKTVSFPETGYNVDSSPNVCSLAGSSPWTTRVVTEIDLPNGQKYTLDYDGTYGKISKITFPGHGYVRYLWGLNTSAQLTHADWTIFNGVYTEYYHCDFIFDIPAITDRFVSFDGVNEVLHQTFAYSTNWGGGNSWGSKQTVVTSTDVATGQVSKTTYSYSSEQGDLPAYVPPPPYLNQIPVESSVVYQNGAGSTTYKTVYKSWQSPHVMLGEQTILDNNSNYGTTTLRCYDANEQVTNLYEYSFPTEGSYPGDPSCVSSSGLSAAARGPLRRQTATPYAQFWNWNNGNPTGTHIVNAPASSTTSDGSGTTAKQTLYSYDENALQTSGAINLTNPGITRANISTLQRWISGTTYAKTTYRYYDTGQLYKMTDACAYTACSDMTGTDHTTTYSYVDSYASGTGTPPGQTNAYLTSVTYPNTGVAHTESFTWGYSDGQIRSRTDQNGQTTSFQYVDPGNLGRLSEIDYPDTGRTTVSYNDSTFQASINPADAAHNTPNFTVSKAITASMNLVSTTAFDGLGHSVRTLLTSDPEGTDITDTAYSGLAQKWRGFNPYRRQGDATYGYTENAFDPLGRVTQTTMQDGAGSKVQTAYSGSCATVTDEAGRQRQSCTDGLGRLTKVVEDPNGLAYETDYQYDTLNNLFRVDQKGGTTDQWRTRTFTYDALSRLTSATNPELGTISHPEWGTITYTYDANGNLASKTAPKPDTIPAQGALTVATTFSYDNLNRLIQKSYNDGATATVKYGYDGVALTGCTTTPPSLTDNYPKPLRTAMCDGSGATSWKHDKMGRTLNEKRSLVATSAVTKTTSYTYNLDGSLATLTYPSGRTVTYGVNGAGRLISAADVANNINYLSWDCPQSQYCYAPSGAEMRLKYGAVGNNFAGIVTGNLYNNRLQPSVLAAAWSGATIISRSYDFHSGSGDNGNVLQIVNGLDGTRTQNFTYDALNRIKTAATQGSTGNSCWGQMFGHMNGGTFVPGIDAWGNLTEITPTNGQCSSPTLSQSATTQNQFSGFCYDLAGNLLSQIGNCPGSLPYTPSYVYDAENRLRSINQTTVPYYTYDGDGKRVIKTYVVNRLYWTGTGSDTLTETDANGNATADYIYANGRRVARVDLPGGTVHYYFSDHLGSASVIAKIVNGNSVQVEQESDYLPYGTERVITSGDSNRYKFTGKERDSESGLDMFGARYYASTMGRFMTPDWSASSNPDPVPYADLRNPQSLNLYAYVKNNPTTLTDPNGHCDVDGEHHNWIWCAAHAVGITQTQKEQADAARQVIAGLKNMTLNGQSPSEYARNATNQQVIAAERVVVEFLTAKAMESLASGGCPEGAKCGIVFPVDFATKGTNNWSATFESEGEARAFARTKLGSDAVEVEPGKWRSADGKWQYRAKPGDVSENHAHLEQLNPQTGEVIQNVHLRWPEGTGR